MKRFGLIGRSLAHSFSKTYFEKKFSEAGLRSCSYENIELKTPDELREFLSQQSDFSGFNVTSPYKESVIQYMNYLTPDAEKIGAVNCISVTSGKLTGFNTDHFGFSQSLRPFLSASHRRALVLGTGGAARAVSYALKNKGLEVFFATSSPSRSENMLGYDDINENVFASCTLIVNATPLGTFPDVMSVPPVPFDYFTAEHFAVDLVYNPPVSCFLKLAADRGAMTLNGLDMLRFQADKSWEIWNG